MKMGESVSHGVRFAEDALPARQVPEPPVVQGVAIQNRKGELVRPG